MFATARRLAASHAERIGLLFARLRRRSWPLLARKRRNCVGLVEPHPCVELPRQDRLAIVAPSLGIGAINDPDEALEPRLHQRFPDLAPDLAVAEIEQGTRQGAVVRLPLVAFRQ